MSEEIVPICLVPDDYLLKNKHPLLVGREVLAAVVAGWNPRELTR